MYHYRKANGAGSDLYQSQYPRRCMPSGLPLTVVEVSHSSEALNSSRWFFSHIALCEEHAKSMKTFFDEPMSLYKSRTRSGETCLSWAPETINVGACIFPTTEPFQPQVGTDGARRTPVPQVAPTGSASTILDQTASLTAGSY